MHIVNLLQIRMNPLLLIFQKKPAAANVRNLNGDPKDPQDLQGPQDPSDPQVLQERLQDPQDPQVE